MQSYSQLAQQALQVRDPAELLTALLDMSASESKAFLESDPITVCMKSFLLPTTTLAEQHILKIMITMLAFSGASVENAVQMSEVFLATYGNKKVASSLLGNMWGLLNNPHLLMDSWALYFKNSKQLLAFVKKYFSDMNVGSYAKFLDLMKEEKHTLADLKQYVDNLGVEFFQSHSLSRKIELYPALSECCCEDGMFNRKNNTRRQTIETAILTGITKKISPESSGTLNYLSMGSGGLLQDFILLSRLLVVGYKDINVALVDCVTDYDALTQLKMLIPFAERQGVKLQIGHHQTFVTLSPQRFDLISAIDFESIEKNFSAIIHAHRMLSTRGLFFLSCREYDFCFDKFKNIANRCYLKKQENWRDSLIDAIAAREHLTALYYAAIGYDVEYEWTQIFPLLNTAASQHIHFTLMQPREKSFLPRVLPAKNMQFAPGAIYYFLKLFLPNKSISIEIVADLGAFREVQREYDFVTYAVAPGVMINAYSDLLRLLQWFYAPDTFKTAYRFAGKAYSVPTLLEECTGITNKAIVNIIANYAGFFRQNPVNQPTVSPANYALETRLGA